MSFEAVSYCDLAQNLETVQFLISEDFDKPNDGYPIIHKERCNFLLLFQFCRYMIDPGLSFILQLGPNSLIFSFSCVLPLHTMRAGRYYLYVFSRRQQTFLMKECNKNDARRISTHYMPLQKGSFGCCAADLRGQESCSGHSFPELCVPAQIELHFIS